jgi:UDP-N-acetyl-D-glucosamine dehydrogenase
MVTTSTRSAPLTSGDGANGHGGTAGLTSVGVVGLGYVGLPLAVALARAGHEVVGVDTDGGKLAALRRGEPLADAPEDLGEAVRSERLRFAADPAALSGVEVVVLCLPTPLGEHREPDLSAVVAAAEGAAASIAPGALVVLESTTYPGTTRDVLLPIFERGGRRVGEDFFLAYSPERTDPGNREYGLENTPRLVAGITASCAQRAAELYRSVVDEVLVVSSPEAAELAKLLENVFRAVNIALVNELAVLCDRMGVDVWEVVGAAKTKPFGFMPFYPGPGLGGHCIPLDPFYLAYAARAYDLSAEFVELAGRVNVNMPRHAASRVADALNRRKKPLNGSRVLFLGVSYKANVADLRESPALKVMGLLRDSGAVLSYHDPHVPCLPELGLRSVELTKEALVDADCVVVATDHDAVDLPLVAATAPLVVDLRDAVRRRLGIPPGAPPPEGVEVL